MAAVEEQKKSNVRYALHHDADGKRVVTIAYQIIGTENDDKTQTTKTTVEYGAAIFRVYNDDGKKDVWSKKLKKAHRDTAEGRLRRHPIRVTLTSPMKKVDVFEELSEEQRASHRQPGVAGAREPGGR